MAEFVALDLGLQGIYKHLKLMERHLNDVNTIQTLQEKIMQFESEREEERIQRAEEQKQILD